jgi:hypothetical protein
MTGYIQLELGGKKRGIKFGNYALIEYSKLTGGGVVEVNEVNPLKLCADLIYCGLKNNCYIKKEKEDFTHDDVILWVDDIPMTKVTEVIQVFEQSVKISQGIQNIQETMSPSTQSVKAEGEEPKK